MAQSQERSSTPVSGWAPKRRLLALMGLVLANLCGALVIARARCVEEINSDQLYTYSLYRDLVLEGGRLKDWTLSPVLHCFPDAPLLFASLALTSDVGYGFALYTVGTFSILLLLLFGVFTELGLSPVSAGLRVLCGGLILSALMALCPSPQEVFITNIHGGVLLTGFAVVYLTMIALRRGLSYATSIPLCLIASLAIFSDLFNIPQFLLPIGMALVLLPLLRLATWREVLPTVGLLIAALALSFAGHETLRRITASGAFTQSPFSYTEPSVSTALTSARAFTSVAPEIIGRNLPFFILLCGAIVAIAWTVSGAARDARATGSTGARPSPCVSFFALVALLSFLGTLSTPIAIGQFKDYSSIRYDWPLWITPVFVVLGLFPHGVAGRCRVWGRRLASLGAGLALIALAPRVARFRGLHDLALRHSPEVECLDRLAAENGLRFGYATYWFARASEVQSRRSLRILQVYPNFSINRLNLNVGAFRAPLAAPPSERQFVLIGAAEDREIEQRIGTPESVHECGSMSVLTYPGAQIQAALRPQFESLARATSAPAKE